MLGGGAALRPLAQSVQQVLVEVQKVEHGEALDPGGAQKPLRCTFTKGCRLR